MVKTQTAVKTYGNYINGLWVTAESGTTLKNINPANREQTICEVQN